MKPTHLQPSEAGDYSRKAPKPKTHLSVYQRHGSLNPIGGT